MAYNMKDEKEVAEYLKNLLIEYKFGCYSEKNAESCHLLGDYYTTITQDFAEAAQIYEKNCNLMDYGRSCAKIGTMKMYGKGCERNIEEGYKYMKKGCELNDEIGCTNAGIVAVTIQNLHGTDRSAVINDGVKMLTTACYNQKSEKACTFLSAIYDKGIEGAVEKNAVETYRAALKSCELANHVACSHIARMHELGQGAKKDANLAKSFKERAMELLRQMEEAGVEYHQGIKP